MKEGQIALAALRQADGSAKNRPVVLLCQMPRFHDWLVCGVSTQIHQEVPDFDECVYPHDPDFGASGLKAKSLIRLGFLAVIPSRGVMGAIGAIAPQRHRRLLENLSRHLQSR